MSSLRRSDYGLGGGGGGGRGEGKVTKREEEGGFRWFFFWCMKNCIMRFSIVSIS